MTSKIASLVRLLALLALGISAGLLASQLWPGPGMCGYDSDCSYVMASPLSNMLPGLGVLAFGVLFVSSFSAAERSLSLHRGVAVAVCLTAVVLILWQVLVIGHLCPYCLVVDTAGAAIALLEIFGTRARPRPASTIQTRLVWAGAALFAVGLGVRFGTLHSHARRAPIDGVPPEVRDLWVQGKINVVEVADFQCPQCRRMHAVVEQFLRELGDRAHFELVIAPLPAHKQARDAGRAYLCAEEFGKGDAMAEKLFIAPRLRRTDCEEIASFLGIPRDSFRSCVGRAEIDDRLDEALSWSSAASPNGLPVIWIQDRVIFGVRPIQVLRDAVQAVEHGKSTP